MQIEEKPPFDTPFEWIGGEDRVRALVDRFDVANYTLHEARDVADENGDQNTFDDLVQASKALEMWGTRIGNHARSG